MAQEYDLVTMQDYNRTWYTACQMATSYNDLE